MAEQKLADGFAPLIGELVVGGKFQLSIYQISMHNQLVMRILHPRLGELNFCIDPVSAEKMSQHLAMLLHKLADGGPGTLQ